MESSHAAAAAAAANPPASKKTSRTALSCAPPGSASAAIAARHGCAAAVRPPWFDDRVYPPAGPDSRPGATEAETARKARRRQPHMHTCTPARPSPPPRRLRAAAWLRRRRRRPPETRGLFSRNVNPPPPPSLHCGCAAPSAWRWPALPFCFSLRLPGRRSDEFRLLPSVNSCPVFIFCCCKILSWWPFNVFPGQS